MKLLAMKGGINVIVKLIEADLLRQSIVDKRNMIVAPNSVIETLNWVIRQIRLQPVISTEKRGHWNHVKEHAHMGGDEAKEWDNFYCSECDAPSDRPYDYCPYCGSKNL